MKKFTEIREARRSAQDRLSARAAKHGLGSQKRLDKIKKASDFFSKPPPSFSKDELKKMGYAVESSKVPAGMKFIASYVYKDANGKDHTHRHLRKGSKMNDPVVVYIDDKEWKTFQSFTKAKQAAINHIKGMKESIDEAYYRGHRKATPKKQEPTKMGSKSGSGYDLYHKSYTAALQHAYAWAKKKGYTVDPDDIDSKVASGPKKPSEGRTNSFTLKLKDNPKKMLAVQVYGMGGGKYELNTYIT